MPCARTASRGSTSSWSISTRSKSTVARGADFKTVVENIDIGGPAMIRAAAKNHDWVTVVVDPEDYQPVLSEMMATQGKVRAETRRRLAQTAFARTAAYDANVSNWLQDQLPHAGSPRRRAFAGTLRSALRYGENPHQTAAFYAGGETRFGVATAEQLQGKELSYNNIADTDAAYELVAEFGTNATRLRDHQARQPVRRRGRHHRSRMPTSARSNAIRSARSAACSRSTRRSTVQPPRRSPSSSPK